MANNIPQLRTDFSQALTANLDAVTRQKLRDRFVAAYQGEWNTRVAAGTVDNSTNRGQFAVDKVFDYIQETFRAGSQRENAAALPTPEIIS